MRQPRTGNQLLYAYELKKGMQQTNDIRSYKLQEILDAQVTQHTFLPRDTVEL